MKRYRLTENRLRGMIREAVKGMLSEVKPQNEPVTDDNRYDIIKGGYPRHVFQQYRDENSKIFDQWISELGSAYYRFVDGMRFHQENPINTAKTFGYSKSYKRLILAKQHVRKALDLLQAAKQDMMAEYVGKDYEQN